MHSTDTAPRLVVTLVRVGRDSGTLVRGAAFWTAVLLPLVFLWLLFDGSPALSDPWVVTKLTVLNVVALVVGHGHGTPAHYHQ